MRLAVEENDAKAAGLVADVCRFEMGLDYAGTVELVRRHYPDLDGASWDALLYEADTMEG